MPKLISCRRYKGFTLEHYHGECRRIDSDGNPVKFWRIVAPGQESYAMGVAGAVRRTLREAKEEVDYQTDYPPYANPSLLPEHLRTATIAGRSESGD